MTTTGPRARVALVAVAALGTAALPSAADAAGVPKPPSRCSRLKGKDLLPGNPKVKLVAVPYKSHVDHVIYKRRRWLACTGSRGKAFRVGDTGDAPGLYDSIAGGPTAGTFFVLTADRGSTDAESLTETWRVFDARTGRSYTISSFQNDGQDDSETTSPRPSLPSPRGVVLDSAGASAVLYAPGGYGPFEPDRPYVDLPAGTTTAVATFDVSGKRTIRDTGGPEIGRTSLKLRGTTASWTHGTETRSQDLAAGR